MKKFIKRIIHVFIRTIEVLLAFGIVTLGLTIGRLYFRPIEVKEFLPTLERYILPQNSGLTLDADSVTLGASFQSEGIFHIVIKNMSVLKSDHQPALHFPAIELSYGLKHLLTLNYIPDSLTVKQASLNLIIGPDGNPYLYDNNTQDSKPQSVSGVPLSEGNPLSLNRIFQHLLSFDNVSLENAKIKIDDQQNNQQIDLESFNLNIEKQNKYNHAIQISTVLGIQDQKSPLMVQAQLNRPFHKMSFEMTFDSLDLSHLGRIVPALKEAHLIIAGKVNGLIDFDRSLQKITDSLKEARFQIRTLTPGTLNLPDPLTNVYEVDSAVINGAVGNSLNEIKIAKSTVKLSNGLTAGLEVTISGIGDILNGEPLNTLKIVLKSDLSSLPIEQAPAVWPVATGPDAHAWVKENLSKGFIDKATFTLYFTGDELTDLYGEIPVSGIQVRYLDEMSPVQNFAGLVQLYPDRVLITGNKGNIGHLQLNSAKIDLTDLQDDISHAKIILDITGPVREAISLIDEKPLEFAQIFGLDPKKTDGQATVHTDLSFPLIDDLNTDQVTANVRASITNGVFPTPLNGYSLDKGKLELTVTNQNLNLTGTGEIASIPLTLTWTESFTATRKNDITSRYDLSLDIRSDTLKKLFPKVNNYFDGQAVLTGTIQKNKADILSGNISGDFQTAALNFPLISVQKPQKVPTTLTLSFTNQDQKTTMNYFLNGHTDLKKLVPFQIKGDAHLQDSDYKINLTEVIAPKTDLKASLEIRDKNKLTLRLNGKSWNASGLYNTSNSSEEKDSEPANLTIPGSMDFDISLNRLILDEDHPITNLLANGRKKDNRWQALSLNAVAGSPFNLSYLPKKETLIADTNNLGEFLNHLGITDKITKGKASLKAKQQPNGGFDGEISIKNISLKEPGFLVQAFTILGIVDAIRGKDLFFSEGFIPFEIRPDSILKLIFGECYLAGNSLGLTFTGRIENDQLFLNGSVIPAYLINSLPGKIPLIGTLFKDGEAGGLIGVKYDLTGSFGHPNVNFKPLNSIAPGILGKLFN